MRLDPASGIDAGVEATGRTIPISEKLLEES
jgi:hypothetical protein